MNINKFIKLYGDENKSYIIDLSTVVYISDDTVYTTHFDFSIIHNIEKVQELINQSGYTDDVFLYLHDLTNNSLLVNMNYVVAVDINDNGTEISFSTDAVDIIHVLESVDNIYKKLQTYKTINNDKSSYQSLITSQVNTEIDTNQLINNKYAVAQKFIENTKVIACRKVNN